MPSSKGRRRNRLSSKTRRIKKRHTLQKSIPKRRTKKTNILETHILKPHILKKHIQKNKKDEKPMFKAAQTLLKPKSPTPPLLTTSINSPSKKMNLLECLTEPTTSHKWGDSIPNPTGELYFRDNNSSILAVAHLDFVKYAKPIKHRSIVYAPQLDDRLGAWAILNLFPSMGIKTDVLFTDCEETGQSTAQHFIAQKEYNWIVEFDRNGSDLVMYQYECPEYTKLMESFGFEVEFGSFSDICHLEHLGVTGFNIGTGYYKEHTINCYADLKTTKKQVGLFAGFYNQYKDTPLPISENAGYSYPYIASRYMHNPYRGRDYTDRDYTSTQNYHDNFTDEYVKTDDYLYFDDDDYEVMMTANEFDKMLQLAQYYGYHDITSFVNDGGLDLLGTKSLDEYEKSLENNVYDDIYEDIDENLDENMDKDTDKDIDEDMDAYTNEYLEKHGYLWNEDGTLQIQPEDDDDILLENAWSIDSKYR